MSRYLLDTNILVYLIQASSDFHLSTFNAVMRLEAEQAELLLAPQNIVEFWGVCTRPVSSGGLGCSPADASFRIGEIESRFTVLPETELVYERWKSVVRAVGVSGKQVHDARLAAIMHVNDVLAILTRNVEDFKRYSFLEAIDPEEILAGMR